MAERRLMVFAKAPAPGRVKTRLVPPLTPEQAAAFHEASLLDVVTGARAVHDPVAIHYDERSGSAAFFATRFPDLELRPQGPGDLGERMERAFEEALGSGAQQVAIIGSDSPTLPATEIPRAFARLASNDVVLGPAVDGGYYLVSVRRSAWPRARALFQEISWSSEHVLRQTIRRLRGTGLALDLLSPWYDVDRVDDLRLAALHATPGSHVGRLLQGALSWVCARTARRRPVDVAGGLPYNSGTC